MQEQLIQQPDIIQSLLDASCDAFSISRNKFNENIKNRTRKISSVIKLFSYWIVEKVGFPATIIGRVLQRSNTSVLRAVFLGKSIAQDVIFPVKL